MCLGGNQTLVAIQLQLHSAHVIMTYDEFRANLQEAFASIKLDAFAHVKQNVFMIWLTMMFVVSMHSRSEQNATFLLNRQNQFKKAAISAKDSGNIELAKKYLRMAKVIINVILHWIIVFIWVLNLFRHVYSSFLVAADVWITDHDDCVKMVYHICCRDLIKWLKHQKMVFPLT